MSWPLPERIRREKKRKKGKKLMFSSGEYFFSHKSFVLESDFITFLKKVFLSNAAMSKHSSYLHR